MGKRINKVLLIDDDHPTNFFHEMIIRKMGCVNDIETFRGVKEALEYLSLAGLEKEDIPELIFLDLNMPGLDGWDFMEAFSKMDEKVKSFTKIIVLTTSVSPHEKKKALEMPEILDFKNKPLNPLLVEEILKTYF